MTESKKYLRSIRSEQTELKAMLEQSQRLRYSLLPSAITYDKDRVQASPSDIFTDKMIEACELIDKIDDHVKALELHRMEALNIIWKIEDPRYRLTLELYYTGLKDGRLMAWEDVAKEVNYSIDHIKALHGRALQAFDKIFREAKNERQD